MTKKRMQTDGRRTEMGSWVCCSARCTPNLESPWSHLYRGTFLSFLQGPADRTLATFPTFLVTGTYSVIELVSSG